MYDCINTHTDALCVHVFGDDEKFLTRPTSPKSGEAEKFSASPFMSTKTYIYLSEETYL